MKKIINYISILSSAIFMISCGGDESAQKAQAANAPQARPYPATTVVTKDLETFTSYPASIEGIVNSEVRAKVSGYVIEVLIDEGQPVKAGQILFKLETQSLNQDAQAAKANVNAAQVEVDKLKPLVEKDIISNVQLETAKAKLQQAQSGYNSIQANIGYANIKSPVDGFVGSIKLREGALVSPNNQEPLTTVSNVSKVYAYFSMNETEYLNFIQNQKGGTLQEKIDLLPRVKLELVNGSIYEEEGKIETINSQVNENTGSISFRAVFDNPNRILTNGNSGKIMVPEVYKDVLVVPQEATYELQGNVLALKVGKDDKVSTARLKIKTTIGNLYVVESGLKEGDTIVVKGVSKIKPNTKIKPQIIPFDTVAKPVEKVFR